MNLKMPLLPYGASTQKGYRKTEVTLDQLLIVIGGPRKGPGCLTRLSPKFTTNEAPLLMEHFE